MVKRVFLPTFNIHFGIWPEILFSETTNNLNYGKLAQVAWSQPQNLKIGNSLIDTDL